MRLQLPRATSGWNLIGSDVNFSLADVTFTNDSGNSYTWANAVSNNKVQAYLSYYDNSPATASERKYKYLSTVSGMDDTSLRKGYGYWLYTNEAGNITLPGVGGTWSNATYDILKTRFNNGSEEKSYLNAFVANWITTPQYWDTSTNSFQEVSTTLNPWQGYFFKSNFDNMTLIRQN